MEFITPHLPTIIPHIQKLPTIIPIQNLITMTRLFLLLLSTITEKTMVHHRHDLSHPTHSPNPDQHHHTIVSEPEHHNFHENSHSETQQYSHSRDTSPTPEHHYYSSHTDTHHNPPHYHLSGTQPKIPVHSNSPHLNENHFNLHSESTNHGTSHYKAHLSNLDFHHQSDRNSPEPHPHHFHSVSHDNPPVESDHYHHHKSQESQHYSHSNAHHQSSPETNHSPHHGISKSHHHSHPESHHHHSKDHHHHHDHPDSQIQHSHTGHHLFHSESNHYHSHFKEDHHNDDNPSHLRHSPVGQRSTSPLSNKSDSSASSIIQYDQSTVSYQESSSFPKEKDSLERLMLLQEQNEALHHSLLQTTTQIKCMGAEFKTGHQLLESELQRTRTELSSLMEQFTRLQDNYSCTQQTSHLLEKKLHCVSQSMDGERERLNERISELTEHLSAAKTTIQTLETINVTSMLQDALEKHLKSDDPITHPLPAAAPPAPFMSSDLYERVSDDQSLGTLPEEEESDWSEMGEEARHFSHADAVYFQWQQRQGGWGMVDTESESGGEESKTHQAGHSLQIPHLKFTVHPETLPVPIEDASLARFKPSPEGYRITEVRDLGSSIRMLSVSLEDIHSTGHLKQQQDHLVQLRSNTSMMDLHLSQSDSYADQITCDWREVDREDRSGMLGLESAQKMLNHFIHEGESTHL
ncbi:probable serine/threonine-protein kinase DDB_G0280133 isoform X2 [Carassius auratus]|uniref:Probable serine/threonine-protein kinase DDB_G0280133 isoform X2 n=1 Tax=Carassius auratus TaxID=7957 RepID=A0A6P6NQ56_CARAU|nr:probable serine/threonine-protein kinase DDB_G0280133 isoform X2 [Carassius auratus]